MIEIYRNDFFRRAAFTLAEVLIVLGIIGIIAQVTLPTLYNNADKQVSLTKLKQFYSTMEQAIMLSEIDNGPTNGWSYGRTTNADDTFNWFNTYLAPYMKYRNVEKISSSAIVVGLNNGVDIVFCRFADMEIYVKLNGYLKTNIRNGKDNFYFILRQNAEKNAFIPYAKSINETTRDYWTTGDTRACSKNGSKQYCAGLIMYDGWTIPKDYPYWN